MELSPHKEYAFSLREDARFTDVEPIHELKIIEETLQKKIEETVNENSLGVINFSNLIATNLTLPFYKPNSEDGHFYINGNKHFALSMGSQIEDLEIDNYGNLYPLS